MGLDSFCLWPNLRVAGSGHPKVPYWQLQEGNRIWSRKQLKQEDRFALLNCLYEVAFSYGVPRHLRFCLIPPPENIVPFRSLRTSPAPSSGSFTRIQTSLRRDIVRAKTLRRLVIAVSGGRNPPHLARRHYQIADLRIAGWRHDTALTNAWLAEGAPIADVLTIFETLLRFNLPPPNVGYAVEILWATQHSHTHLQTKA